MTVQVEMPKFGLSMEEGTIAEWLVKVGDKVEKGDPLAEINSEKLTNTAQATAGGFVRKLLLDEDESAPCGEPICILADTMEEDIDAAGAPAAAPAEAGESSVPAVSAAAPAVPAPAAAPAEVAISPRAKKVAEMRGLEYAHITGTGINGMITISDLKRYGRPKGTAPAAAAAAPAPAVSAPAQSPAPAPAAAAPAVKPVYAPAGEAEIVKFSPMQSAICKSMYSSMATSAQTTLATEAHVQSLVDLYASIKGTYAANGIKLSYTAMLLKAVAHALEEHPEIRAQMVDDCHYKIARSIDIGVAVDVPNGLIVPVIRQVNVKDLRTICNELADLTNKAKAGTLTGENLGGAVTTVTNLGMFGVTYFTPVLNAPEGTILGVGALIKKPVERDNGIHLEYVMNLSLTHDHRITNGAPCARYLQSVVKNLQNFHWY